MESITVTRSAAVAAVVITRSGKRVEASFVSALSPEQFPARLGALADRRFALISVTADAAQLRRRVDAFTWGGEVRVRWVPIDQGVNVQIEMVPRFPTALGDYGQGRRDVIALVRELTAPAQSR